MIDLRRFPNLRRLDIDCHNLNDKKIMNWAALGQLESLTLTDTSISDESIDGILFCKNLTYLNLEGTLVTDAGIAKLSKLTKLTSLYLGATDKSRADTTGRYRRPKQSTLEKLERELPNLQTAYQSET